MPCDSIQLPGGGFAIACSRGRRPRLNKCTGCGRTNADRLCDVTVVTPNGGRRGCDRPVCRTCTVDVLGADVCPSHPIPDEALNIGEPVRYARTAD